MRTRTIALAMVAALAAACASDDERRRPRSLPPPPYGVALDEYKRGVADRIVQASAGAHAASMPGVLKSIVVLQITVDGSGQAREVSVFRSNGYAHLDERALASVARAAPFAPPAPALLRGGASVTFLETFLFRDDDLFQVRSLVPAHSEPSTHEKLF